MYRYLIWAGMSPFVVFRRLFLIWAKVGQHFYSFAGICTCLLLDTDLVQVCFFMTSQWRLGLAAILRFSFEVEGCIGAGMYRCYCSLQVMCTLYLCPLTCTYGCALLYTVKGKLHTGSFSFLHCWGYEYTYIHARCAAVLGL